MTFVHPSAHAQGNLITVSPALVDLELGPADQEKTTSFNITNTYNVPVEMSVEVKGIDQVSGRIIPSDNVDQSLLDALHISDTLVTIPENSSIVITATLTNTDNLSPGGHYATIVFTQRTAGNEEVSINQAISVGLFAVKRGGQLREIELTSSKLTNLPFQIPSSATIQINNIGNVHVIPRASTLVYSAGDELIAKAVFNQDSRRILPQREYIDTAKITQSAKIWYPQRLKVVTTYRADGIEEAKTTTQYITYIPAYCYLVFALLLFSMHWLIKRAIKKRKSRKSIKAFEALELTAINEQSDHKKVRKIKVKSK